MHVRIRKNVQEQHPENHLIFKGPTIETLMVQGMASVMYNGLDREELDEEM